MTYVQTRLPLEPGTAENWHQSLAAALFLVGGTSRHNLPTLNLFESE